MWNRKVNNKSPNWRELITSNRSSFHTPVCVPLPATMNPPSKVCCTEWAIATPPALPYAFCQTIPPEASSLRTQGSWESRFTPTPKEWIKPATMNPPSEVCCTEYARSLLFPPYTLTHESDGAIVEPWARIMAYPEPSGPANPNPESGQDSCLVFGKWCRKNDVLFPLNFLRRSSPFNSHNCRLGGFQK